MGLVRLELDGFDRRSIYYTPAFAFAYCSLHFVLEMGACCCCCRSVVVGMMSCHAYHFIQM